MKFGSPFSCEGRDWLSMDKGAIGWTAEAWAISGRNRAIDPRAGRLAKTPAFTGAVMTGKSTNPRFRFESKYVPHPVTGCWLWCGARTDHGYGNFEIDGRYLSAHSFAYMIYRGPVIAGLELDHLCRERACVNPYHLEAVTHAENLRRSDLSRPQNGDRNRQKTHCPQGHEFSKENTYRTPRGGRRCRTCDKARSRARPSRAR